MVEPLVDLGVAQLLAMQPFTEFADVVGQSLAPTTVRREMFIYTLVFHRYARLGRIVKSSQKARAINSCASRLIVQNRAH